MKTLWTLKIIWRRILVLAKLSLCFTITFTYLPVLYLLDEALKSRSISYNLPSCRKWWITLVREYYLVICCTFSLAIRVYDTSCSANYFLFGIEFLFKQSRLDLLLLFQKIKIILEIACSLWSWKLCVMLVGVQFFFTIECLKIIVSYL